MHCRVKYEVRLLRLTLILNLGEGVRMKKERPKLKQRSMLWYFLNILEFLIKFQVGKHFKLLTPWLCTPTREHRREHTLKLGL